MKTPNSFIAAFLCATLLSSASAVAGTAAIDPLLEPNSRPLPGRGPALPGSKLPEQPLTEAPKFAGKRSVAMSGMQNLKAGSILREQNKLDPDMVTTASGLQYKVLKQGDGPLPKKGDRVQVYYQGATASGTMFASANRPGKPTTYPWKDLVKGMREALKKMPTGSKWQIFVPPDLGYGATGLPPDVGPSATLIYTVELVGVLPPAGKTKAAADGVAAAAGETTQPSDPAE